MYIQKPKVKKKKPQRQYHGHTTIELRDARTGSRERIESDNEFTLGINHFLTDGGFFNNSPFANETWRNREIYRNLIGGIMLFDSEIQKKDGVWPIIMPAGTKMVANGSYGVANSGNPTELGSFNEIESSFNKDALTFVYDWETSQGNGNIECVSLTSDVGGYIGMGNSVSNKKHATYKSLFENQNMISIYVGSIYIGHAIKGNYQYDVTKVENNSFTYTKKRLFLDEVNLFPLDDSYTVDIPSDITRDNNLISAGHNGKVVIIANRLIKDKNYTFGIYDCDEGTWQKVTFTAPETFSEIRTWGCILTDECLFLRPTYGNGRYIVRFDGSVKSMENNDNITRMCDDLYCARQSDETFAIIDFKNNTTYPTNGSIGSLTKMHLYKEGQIIGYNEYSSDQYMYRFRNPLYLATVNNLDEPVQKTASKTMKVTYIVTPA